MKNHDDQPEAVAAKLVDTFMHQLMKFAECHELWESLHLPLDRKMLTELYSLRNRYQYQSLEPVRDVLKDYKDKPYKLLYRRGYIQLQNALSDFCKEVKQEHNLEWTPTSRIELNLLWAVD